MPELTYRRACKITRSLGMSVSDGLGFTVCGGQLVNGEDAPDWVAEMNGWSVEEIARSAQARNPAGEA